MNITTYYVNTFTDKLFSGNPAAVCILESELPTHAMQSIAEQNSLPATVFLTRECDFFRIRWLTPEYEIQLCGHEALAAGYVIFNILEPNWDSVNLHHPVAGILNINGLLLR